MNLFKKINKKQVSGMIMPAAIIFTFVSMMVTVGYMERVLNKKINLDLRMAKIKARFNAESGVAITISGPTDGGAFIPSLASSDWPLNTDEEDDSFDENIIDTETFPGYYKPENVTSFFPNAGIPNTSDIDMGEFYNITLKAYGNEITRRPERSALAYGRSKVKNIWGDEVYMVDSAEVSYTVEVLSDFMYLTHHELAGGAPGIYGRNNDSDLRRQPCFGPDDGLGFDEQSLVGFTQTLDPMLICDFAAGLSFDNLVYVTKATNTQYTEPPYWVETEYNTTNVAEGDSIMPDWGGSGLNANIIFLSDEGPEIHPGYEVKPPVCFPLKGYKETVLSANYTYDATEMLKLSNQNNFANKDTLIMTDIEFLDSGGFRVKRWWYLLPPYLRSDILTCNGQEPVANSNVDCNGDNLPDYQFSMPYHLEGMPDINPYNPELLELNQINALCGGPNITNTLIGDLTQCEPYEEALHDFSSTIVTSHPTSMGVGSPLYNGSSYNEEFNTDYEEGFGMLAGGPGGGPTRLSHFDIENFTNSPQNTGNQGTEGYFLDKGWNESNNWNLDQLYTQGGNLLTDDVEIPPQGLDVIIYVMGGPVRVHGKYKGAYTVVTSGWDAVDGNNCLDAGCAGYDGYSTYRRHAWFTTMPMFTHPPVDTIPANIWIIDDLTNADASGNGGPPQPDVYDFWGDIICDFDEPGDCGGSENIMGLVSAANVVVANSEGNRNNGINLHASVAALNESFVMHYWQHGYTQQCPNWTGTSYDNNAPNINDECSQTPPQADNRGRQLWNGEPSTVTARGELRLWGGIIQKHRGYMKRQTTGPYLTDHIGMDKNYKFDNNLYFPPPGAIKITECESNTVRMNMIGYGRPQ